MNAYFEPVSLLLYGMGGHALVILDACRLSGYNVVGYFDDESSRITISSFNLPPYLGNYQADLYPNLPLIIAVGNNESREKISKQVIHKPFTLIHPKAIVADSANIGSGSVILAGAIVQAKANLGLQVIVNAGAVIDHEALIGDFVHIRSLAYLGGAANIASHATIPPLHVVERNMRFGYD